MQETWVWALWGKMPWRRKWQSTPVFLPGKFHRQRSLVGYSPWGPRESDATEWLSTCTQAVIHHKRKSKRAFHSHVAETSLGFWVKDWWAVSQKAVGVALLWCHVWSGLLSWILLNWILAEQGEQIHLSCAGLLLINKLTRQRDKIRMSLPTSPAASPVLSHILPLAPGTGVFLCSLFLCFLFPISFFVRGFLFQGCWSLP